LSDLAAFNRWWDTRTERVDLRGPLTPGQTIYATTRALVRVKRATEGMM
jgi:hypothetical protein